MLLQSEGDGLYGLFQREGEELAEKVSQPHCMDNNELIPL